MDSHSVAMDRMKKTANTVRLTHSYTHSSKHTHAHMHLNNFYLFVCVSEQDSGSVTGDQCEWREKWVSWPTQRPMHFTCSLALIIYVCVVGVCVCVRVHVCMRACVSACAQLDVLTLLLLAHAERACLTGFMTRWSRAAFASRTEDALGTKTNLGRKTSAWTSALEWQVLRSHFIISAIQFYHL